MAQESTSADKNDFQDDVTEVRLRVRFQTDEMPFEELRRDVYYAANQLGESYDDRYREYRSGSPFERFMLGSIFNTFSRQNVEIISYNESQGSLLVDVIVAINTAVAAYGGFRGGIDSILKDIEKLASFLPSSIKVASTAQILSKRNKSKKRILKALSNEIDTLKKENQDLRNSLRFFQMSFVASAILVLGFVMIAFLKNGNISSSSDEPTTVEYKVEQKFLDEKQDRVNDEQSEDIQELQRVILQLPAHEPDLLRSPGQDKIRR